MHGRSTMQVSDTAVLVGALGLVDIQKASTVFCIRQSAAKKRSLVMTRMSQVTH
jgi:hypothetical protein